MSRGWPGWRAWLTGIAAVAALGLLSAKAVDDPQERAPATQPAALPTTQPSPDAVRLTPAGEHLISGLIGSPHDFTQVAGRGRDLCLPCHTPHLVAAPPPRLDRRPTTTQPLRPYQGVGIELSGWSLLCLGCHDGVTAGDVYSSPHAITVADQLAGRGLGARGLRSHPVGIEYPPRNTAAANAVAVDPRVGRPPRHPPSRTGSDADWTQAYEPRAAVEAAGLLLPDGRIQCTTCHDAHNTYRHDGMLRISNERSRLCLTCHRL